MFTVMVVHAQWKVIDDLTGAETESHSMKRKKLVVPISAELTM
jgi:hypothetical protein